MLMSLFKFHYYKNVNLHDNFAWICIEFSYIFIKIDGSLLNVLFWLWWTEMCAAYLKFPSNPQIFLCKILKWCSSWSHTDNVQAAEDIRFLGRGRTLSSTGSQIILAISSDSNLQARLLDNSNSNISSNMATTCVVKRLSDGRY